MLFPRFGEYIGVGIAVVPTKQAGRYSEPTRAR